MNQKKLNNLKEELNLKNGYAEEGQKKKELEFLEVLKTLQIRNYPLIKELMHQK